ncbi:MAG TPA: SpoIID/LytB domain-containing protein [Tepidisphaeraceae bacterium]|nr:SpoIID/LytB domain-containing protein [Tepidisphaeraceae bacterium]
MEAIAQGMVRRTGRWPIVPISLQPLLHHACSSATRLAILLSLLPLGCNHAQSIPESAPGAPMVRVLVLENRPRVNLTASEAPSVHVGTGAAQPLDISPGAAIPVSLTALGWKLGAARLGFGQLTVEPASDGTVRVDGHAYRGRYRFIPRGGGTFDVVNDVDVDGYLMGVLPKEMYASWHKESYRALAVVARTYAVYVSRTNAAASGYDLFADTRSMMYGGMDAESAKSRAAVEATRGIVLAYGAPGQEKIFKAYYSSCCGGVTQDASDAFGEPPIEPLSEQNIGPRCTESPYFNWPTVTISRTELTRRIRLWGAHNNAPEANIGPVLRIDILSSNHFGRPASFIITDTRGYQYRLNCEDTRLAINTDANGGATLPSSFCRPVNSATDIRFTQGHGYGHGVGLCQWCTQHEAIAGVPYRQIVLSAFPKAVLLKAY